MLAPNDAMVPVGSQKRFVEPCTVGALASGSVRSSRSVCTARRRDEVIRERDLLRWQR